MNYDFIEYFRRAYEESTHPELKREAFLGLRQQEANRDFHTG